MQILGIRRARGVALSILALAGAAGGTSAQDPIALQPAAALGDAPFTLIRGVHELPDGRVLIADQRENALWVVDLARGTRERVGREGAGPDEYRNPVGIWPFRGDSVILEDLGNGRLSFWGPALRMGRTVPMFSIGGTLPGAADTLGSFYIDNAMHVLRLHFAFAHRIVEESANHEIWTGTRCEPAPMVRGFVADLFRSHDR